MLRENFERLLHARQNFEERLAVSSNFLCFGRQSFTQKMNLFSNVVMTKSLVAQTFSHDLQVSHPGDLHVCETSRCAKHFFKYRNRVLLIGANAQRPNQRAVNVPEENAKVLLRERVSGRGAYRESGRGGDAASGRGGDGASGRFGNIS